ncbi:hypothetical protein HPB51_019746 [Rhipicephalus microplus]|uniref:Uncharacterized protein n=1 Tax=Rhipicephalus microplus TaxID=6941 RepID=A0A9J6F863_RHIMP|nr:hypothetical protein HPB51_019746 [Rhipicephalus microplus]
MMSRRKSFKKSLRESFRRLRKGRSQRGRKDKSMTKSPESRRPRRGEEEGSTSSAVASPASRHNESAIDPGSPLSEAKPVERQVEARSTDDALSSMVRCLCFSSSFILHSESVVANSCCLVTRGCCGWWKEGGSVVELVGPKMRAALGARRHS